MTASGLQAGLWGLLTGGALVVGAGVGYTVRLSQRVVAGVMAFGTGVLISALSFELVQPAFRQGGLAATSSGFAAGGVLAMVVDTMVPEAFAGTHSWSGLIAAAGFIGAFALSTLEA